MFGVKRILAALICLGISLVLCLTEFICIEKNADKFIKQLENIEEALYTEDRETASEIAKRIDDEWQDTVYIVDMLLYHDYVDQIGQDLSALSVYIEYEEEAEIYATCEKTKRQLKTLIENEKPTVENII